MKRLAFLLAMAAAASLFGATDKTKTAYVCSLTKKSISACCCTHTRDGKLYCTLAKKTISSCCCKQTAAR